MHVYISKKTGVISDRFPSIAGGVVGTGVEVLATFTEGVGLKGGRAARSSEMHLDTLDRGVADGGYEYVK